MSVSTLRIQGMQEGAIQINDLKESLFADMEVLRLINNPLNLCLRQFGELLKGNLVIAIEVDQ